jgi:hypothetical protein
MSSYQHGWIKGLFSSMHSLNLRVVGRYSIHPFIHPKQIHQGMWMCNWEYAKE